MLRMPPRAAPPTGGAAAAGALRARCTLRCGAAAPRTPLRAPLPRTAAPALAVRCRPARLRTPTPRARLCCAASTLTAAVADDSSAAAAEPPAPAPARFDADELSVLLIAAVVFLDRRAPRRCSRAAHRAHTL
jgi:hypothetical protein